MASKEGIDAKEVYCQGTYQELPNGKGSVTFITPVWREPPASEEADPPPPEGDQVGPEIPDSTQVSMAFALNGKNYQPLASGYTFYEEPAGFLIAPGAAAVGDGQEFTLSGPFNQLLPYMVLKAGLTLF